MSEPIAHYFGVNSATGFTNVTLGGPELKAESKNPEIPYAGGMAARDALEKQARLAKKKNEDKYQQYGPLLYLASADAKVAKSVYYDSSIDGKDINAGGKFLVNFACSSPKADTVIRVAIDTGAEKKVKGGDITCGHNQLVEGSFEVA